MLGNTPEEKNTLPVPRKRSLWKRWALRAVLAGAILAGLGALWIHFYLNPYLKGWLIRQVDKGSEGVYRLAIKDLYFSVWRMSLEVRGVHLYTQKPSKNGVKVEVKAKELHIRRVHWWRYWWANTLRVEEIELDAPQIDLYSPKTSESKPLNLQKFLADIAKVVHVDKFTLRKARCGLYVNTPVGKVFHQFSRLDVRMEDLHLEAKGAWSLYDFNLQVQDYQFITPDKAYILRCQHMEASKRKKRIVLRQARFSSWQDNARRTQIVLYLPRLQLSGIDFETAWEARKFRIRAIDVKQASIALQTAPAGKAVAFSPKDLPMLVENFPVSLSVDSLRIGQASFSFKQPTNAGMMSHKAREFDMLLTSVRLGQASKPTKQDLIAAQYFRLSVQDFVHESPATHYRFSAGKLYLSSRDSILRIEDGALKPLLPAEEWAKSLAYQSIISRGRMPLIEARKVDFAKILHLQAFHLGSLHLYAPEYEAVLDATKPKQGAQKFRNFEQMLRSIPLEIQADTLGVHGAKVFYKALHFTQGDTMRWATHTLDKLDFTVLRIDLGKALHESAIEQIDTKKLHLKVAHYAYQNPEGSYKFVVEGAEARAAQRTIHIDGLHFLPTETNQHPNRIRLYVPNLRAEGVDFVSFMLKQQMDWDKLLVEGARVEIYTTQAPKRRSKTVKDLRLENTLLNLPAFIKLDTLKLQEATFALHELNLQGAAVAEHTIENVNAQLLDIGVGEASQMQDDAPQFWNDNSLAFDLRRYTYRAQGLTYRFSLHDIEKQAYSTHWRIGALAWASNIPLKRYREQFPDRGWLAEGSLRSVDLSIPRLRELIFRRNLAIETALVQEPDLRFWLFETASKPTTDRKEAKDWWKDLQREIPLQFSVDSFLMQHAKIQVEMPNKWKQKVLLEVSGAGLRCAETIQWRRVAATGKDFLLSYPQGTLKAEAWRLLLDAEPIFLADKASFSWKMQDSLPDSWLEVAQIRASFLPMEIGKPLKFNYIHLNKGKGDITVAALPSKNTRTESLPALFVWADSLLASEIALKIHRKTPSDVHEHSLVLETGKIEQLFWKGATYAALDWELFALKIRDYELRMKHELNQMRAKSVVWQNSPNVLIAKQITLSPTVSNRYFRRLLPYQKTLFRAEIGKLEARDIDFPLFVKEQAFHAPHILLDSVCANLFLDKRLPSSKRPRLMPAQQLLAMKRFFGIDTLDIQRGVLTYYEQAKGMPHAGEFFISDVQARLLGLRNRSAGKDSIELTAAGKVMGTGAMKLRYMLALSQDFHAKIEGTLGAFEPSTLSPFLEASRHIQIRKGTVQKGVFWADMRDTLAIGELEASYKHLRLDLLNKKKDNRKRGVLSMLANIFIKNRNNMNKNHHKIAQIYYVRRPEESFVRFFVKSLVMGILNMLNVPPNSISLTK